MSVHGIERQKAVATRHPLARVMRVSAAFNQASIAQAQLGSKLGAGGGERLGTNLDPLGSQLKAKIRRTCCGYGVANRDLARLRQHPNEAVLNSPALRGIT